MALLMCPPSAAESAATLGRLGAQLGLERLDQNLCADEESISSIQVREQARPQEYVPYTNRSLSWHTDGYYNDAEHQIRAWSLLCVRSAPDGGENALLDPEIAYIRLRDKDPELIRVLSAPNALTIPANREDAAEIRPERSGPVFSVDPCSGTLHMRYSARKRNVVWHSDPVTDMARAFLDALFSRGEPPIFRHRLEAGHCLVSNNVLHNRSAFREEAGTGRGRLLYRARYYDRIAETGMDPSLVETSRPAAC